MKTLIVGHRGTGKTAFLRRVQRYYRSANRSCLHFDLDAEIVKQESCEIGEIFSQRGEAAFRELERAVLHDIARKTLDVASDVFVSAGAGFDGQPPEGWRCLWLKRPTDAKGRVFTDRPRLNPNLSAHDEFLQRFAQREPRYQAMSHEVLLLPEGFDFENEPERAVVLGTARDIGGALTLFPANLQTGHAADGNAAAQSVHYIESRIAMGIRWFELRDDLLSVGQMRRAAALIPRDRLIYSFRAMERQQSGRDFIRDVRPERIDWPSEWGEPPTGIEPTILSLHARAPGENLTAILSRFTKLERSDRILKIAVPIQDFKELEEGDRWFAQGNIQANVRTDNQPRGTRAFLPLSADGRWAWYRLLMKNQLPLNFVREADGSSFDQPILLDWLRRQAKRDVFAAILGDPVAHSRTPAEQWAFFHERDIDVLAIRLRPEEWDQGALDFLKVKGLRYAAVTAPLKERAFVACATTTPEAKRLQAVNTLYVAESHVSENQWLGTNTDLGGLRAALEELQATGSLTVNFAAAEKRVAIWGGGGTLTTMEEVLPKAVAFSARTGQPREAGSLAADWQPELVVWAVGRSRINEGLSFPPVNWRPRYVFDLNYSDDSPGRDYALMCGAEYVSGLSMFRKQAELQRRFWSENGG